MKNILLVIAFVLVLLGVVGYFVIPKLTQKSKIEQISENSWRVTLYKVDDYVNTGIPINDHSYIQITAGDIDPNTAGATSPSKMKWLAKINDIPTQGTDTQQIDACVREKGEIAFSCSFVPEGFRGNLYLKNDSPPESITVRVYARNSTRPGDAGFPK